MKRKTIWLLLGCLMAAAILFSSCSTSAPTTTPTIITTTTPTIKPTTPPATTPTTAPAPSGKWWDKWGEPRYGGTLTVALNTDFKSFDPVQGIPGCYVTYETLGNYDWVLDRQIWGFQTLFCPIKYRTGQLAESWERPDNQTMIFHIRKGVYWQNKPPVNGRELTAADITYSFNRYCGTGEGFTKPSPLISAGYLLLESVKATDNYTVVFKWKKPSLEMADLLLDAAWQNTLVAKEVINLDGNAEKWEHLASTGPFILTDYVRGSSATFDRNPNYWDYDERYPKNRLPYIDSLKQLIIPDVATRLAGIRSAKIDQMQNLEWNQAVSLKKTNPEIVQLSTPYYGMSLDYRLDTAPFTDIKVRKALQMSIDLKTIAQTYYGGTVDGKPCGLISPVLNGYYTPYDQWPQEVKAEYAYNPTRAKELLSEAGYPKGFKTNVETSSAADLALLQIIKAYFLDIGVDMEIIVKDPASFGAILTGGKQRQMVCAAGSTANTSLTFPPSRSLTRRYSKEDYNFTKDAIYDQLFEKFAASLDLEEQRKLTIQMNDRIIAQHWSLHVLPTVQFNISQPWVKGYSGEYISMVSGFYYARFWIDRN